MRIGGSRAHTSLLLLFHGEPSLGGAVRAAPAAVPQADSREPGSAAASGRGNASVGSGRGARGRARAHRANRNRAGGGRRRRAIPSTRFSHKIYLILFRAVQSHAHTLSCLCAVSSRRARALYACACVHNYRTGGGAFQPLSAMRRPRACSCCLSHHAVPSVLRDQPAHAARLLAPRHHCAIQLNESKPGGIQLPVRWSCISMPVMPIIAARPLLSSMLSLVFFSSGSV